MEDKGPQPNRETSTKVVFQSLTGHREKSRNDVDGDRFDVFPSA
jgi:hypothetical protein